MRKDVKRIWVKALRSGEYKQLCGALRAVNSDDRVNYCCLGVLCDVTGAEWIKDQIAEAKDGTTMTDGQYLSDAMLRELDMSFDTMTRLAIKNDNGSSFNQIANWIERNL